MSLLNLVSIIRDESGTIRGGNKGITWSSLYTCSTNIRTEYACKDRSFPGPYCPNVGTLVLQHGRTFSGMKRHVGSGTWGSHSLFNGDSAVLNVNKDGLFRLIRDCDDSD